MNARLFFHPNDGGEPIDMGAVEIDFRQLEFTEPRVSFVEMTDEVVIQRMLTRVEMDACMKWVRTVYYGNARKSQKSTKRRLRFERNRLCGQTKRRDIPRDSRRRRQRFFRPRPPT